MRKTSQVAVLTPSVTSDEARLRLRIDSFDTETDQQINDELTALIASATALATGKTRRSIAETRYKLQVEGGFGNGAIRLDFPDVTGIESIKYIDAAGAEQTLPDTEYKLVLGEFARPVLCWPKARSFEITYKAGWGASAPDALKHFILLQVGHWYRNREIATDRAMITVPYGESLIAPFKIPLEV